MFCFFLFFCINSRTCENSLLSINAEHIHAEFSTTADIRDKSHSSAFVAVCIRSSRIRAGSASPASILMSNSITAKVRPVGGGGGAGGGEGGHRDNIHGYTWIFAGVYITSAQRVRAHEYIYAPYREDVLLLTTSAAASRGFALSMHPPYHLPARVNT